MNGALFDLWFASYFVGISLAGYLGYKIAGWRQKHPYDWWEELPDLRQHGHVRVRNWRTWE